MHSVMLLHAVRHLPWYVVVLNKHLVIIAKAWLVSFCFCTRKINLGRTGMDVRSLTSSWATTVEPFNNLYSRNIFSRGLSVARNCLSH